MTETLTTVPLQDEPDPANQERITRDDVHALFTDIRNEMENMALRVVVEEFKKIKAEPPNREHLPTPPQKEKALFGFGAVRPRVDYLYESLHPIFKPYRSPKQDEHCARWLRAMAHKDMATLREIDTIERAATLEGAAGANAAIGSGTGAPLVPIDLAQTIILNRNLRARFRPLCQRFTATGHQLRVPVATTVTVTMAAEQQATPAAEPTLSTVLLAKHKMIVGMSASNDMLEDSAFNLVTFFAERAGSAMGAKEDSEIATSDGTGNKISLGFDGAAIPEYVESPAATMKYKDVVGLFFDLPAPYQNTATFFGNNLMMSFLSSLVDLNGRPIFVPAVAAPQVVTDYVNGAVGTIFSRPVINVPVANGNLYVGDLSYYGILDGGSIRSAASTDVLFNTDSVQFRFTQRFDGNVLLLDAFRVMKGITAVG